ncbi:Ig-like domain-containing protein, partial [Vibrio sp. 10N.247.311.49]|uniref:Ig-like domain-containing protein n=1 Tax=Vibrio sp. 10N.247.311.49 TaxID=3229993 RepID=UPI003553AFC8
MDITALNLTGALALGQRIVISVDGTVRVLEEGEPLQAGDVTLESQNGPNEPQVSVKRFSPEDGEVELDQDIANIFAALEEGEDPTELGDEFATAAGQNGSSLATSGTVERDGEETIPATEFITTGFEALGMSRTQSLSLLDAFRSIEQSGSQGTDSETIGDTTAPDAPTLTLDTDSGSAADDFLTNDGSFTVDGTEDGATVEYLVDGNWTTTAPVPTEGDNTITVRQTDAAGNTSGSSTLTFTLDTTAPDAPTLTLDTDSGSAADDFLTNDSSFTVGGTEEGATVEYLVDGNWTTTAPVPTEGDNTITVRQTDAAGNTSGSSELTFTLDTTAPDAPTLTLDTDSGSAADDFLTNDGSFTVDGTEDGATVEYLVDGNWTTTAPVPTEGDNTITVRQTDAAGNTSGSSTLTFTLDTQAESGNVIVDSITSDDVVTETEKEQTIFVTGTATGGDIQPNDVVTAVINGATYTSVVKENGIWELSVNGEDLAEDTEFTVSVSSTDSAGNSVSSSGTSTHIYDSTPVNVNIDIDPITEDSVINATEAQGTVTITGSITGEDYVSGTVTLTINGVVYTGQVIDGKYSIDVNGSDLNSDSDNIVDAKVDVVNEAGNVGSATSTEFYLVDLAARGTIFIESITDDNVINQSESESTVSVKGTVGRDADTGDQVSVVVNGVTYLTVVQSDKTWSVDVQGSDLVADNSVTATVTGQDWVGNEFSSSISRTYDLDTDISKPTIDLVASSDSGDSDTDNLTNDKTPTFSLGNIDDDVVAAGIVVLKDGVALEGTLTEEQDGTWSFTPSADLADGTYDLSVKVTDDAGNSATSTELEVIIDTEAAATITIDDDIAGDDIVNAAEAAGDVTITGTVGGDAKPGDTVTLTVNGNSTDYTGTVKADGTYSINVPGSELVADADSTIVASVSGTDEAGNPFTATTEASGDNKDGGYEVDTDISKPTIDLVASSDSGD